MRLGVSRAALREALGQLAERGLVVRRHGAGTFVSDQPDARRADPWTQLLQRQPLMQADLLEFRDMLETRCAALAAERADAADLARLAERHAAGAPRPTPAPTARAQVRADVAFHRAIADATGNPVFSYLVATLLALLHEHVHMSIAVAPDSAEAHPLAAQHAALLAAIQARDAPGAARAARQHIDFVRQRWQRALED